MTAGRLLPAAALVALTAVVMPLRLDAIDGPAERLVVGQRIAGTAHVVAPPRPGPFGISVEVALARPGENGGTRLLARLPREVHLPAGMAPGTEVRLSGVIDTRAPADSSDGGDGGDGHRATGDGAPPAGGGDFDLAAYLRQRGLAGELAVDRVRLTGGRRGGWEGTIDGIRERALTGIAAGLPPGLGALGQGMVLGADEEISDSVREDFRASGLAHVLAASGQNVMLLVALAIPLLAAVGLSHRARLPVLIGLIALYVPLAGGGASIQRAGVMGAAGLLAMLLARPASRWYALLLAACVTLALDPRA